MMLLKLLVLLISFIKLSTSNLNLTENRNVDIESTNEYLGPLNKHLFWFVHVTDLHITHIGHEDRAEQFEKFCTETLINLIKPPVVVVTGDLVHSVGDWIHNHGSTEQYEEEWIRYNEILNRTKITENTAWLDMRGNHDNFMDSDPDSLKSYYRRYSHQGLNHSSSYHYVHKTSEGDQYSFIGIDMCPRPGAGRPFNFLGQITKSEMRHLLTLTEQTKMSNATIFFGHYPLSFTYSSTSPGIQYIMRNALAYLNGHLHAGIPHLYALHSNGLLELELGDWKVHRLFRLVTIDGGLLAFTDFQYNKSIYAVITNPKRAKYKTPRESLYRLKQSTHIRILIFSKHQINNVRVSIDSKFIGYAVNSINNLNLFILQWNTSLYEQGTHIMHVQIQDYQNNTEELMEEFALSISSVIAWNRSKLILLVHWSTFGIILLVLSLCAYITTLVCFRYRATRMLNCCPNCCSLWNSFHKRMMLLCSVDVIYYPLLGLAIYYFIGPWYIGYFTKDYFGAAFLWGTVIHGIYLYPDTQPFMGTVQLYMFVFPLTFALACSVYYRYIDLQTNVYRTRTRLQKICRILTYVIFGYAVFFIFMISLIFTLSYNLGWILSPFGLFLIIFTVFLFYKTNKLELNQFGVLLNKTDGDTADIHEPIFLSTGTTILTFYYFRNSDLLSSRKNNINGLADSSLLPQSKLFTYVNISSNLHITHEQGVLFHIERSAHFASLKSKSVRGNHQHKDASEIIVLLHGKFQFRVGEKDAGTSEDYIFDIRDDAMGAVGIKITAEKCHALKNIGTSTNWFASYYLKSATDDKLPQSDKTACASIKLT
ncbi:unnamed protein product [Didymodactylos carnosus]|uniref:Calcineurin-like phosphoesterase domain-containing protein n=1 Tax=Didymodactylos carnosus TaxID=1234261 RepID=A0A813PKL9_9BILA|nr:unnamed protein product [Didymodactylos carnosus]CAF3535780.1 unnamed protein product [Didymodactylos carnosus]